MERVCLRGPESTLLAHAVIVRPAAECPSVVLRNAIPVGAVPVRSADERCFTACIASLQ